MFYHLRNAVAADKGVDADRGDVHHIHQVRRCDTMDYAFLPPEINSTRMYTGPASGSFLAAAGSWDSLSAELGITAQTYKSVVSGLTGLQGLGPASASMAAAATPYVQWLTTTAAQAQQTATQAMAAVAAFETAFAMTVAPEAVFANRAQLAALVPRDANRDGGASLGR
jgi:PPE-repeat protein